MNVLIYDIETLKEFFLVVVYDPSEGRTHEFSVNRHKNEIDAFVRFAEAHGSHYWVGYNNLRFDSQVIEWVLRHHEEWHELSALEVAAKIAEKAQDVIHDANFEVLPEYAENSLTLKQIDLFKLNHFDNKNRMVSLKRLEFEMDMENIEEMPIHHSKENLSKEDIQSIKKYCRDDIKATYEFYKHTIGEVKHPLYKGNDQVKLRLDNEEEFGIPCLNYSDSKIGDEIIKKFYCEEKKIEYSKLPKKGFFRKYVDVKNCIAKYIQFQTPELKGFLESIKKESIGMDDDFKHTLNFYDNVYSFMKGGLHTENKPKIFEANDTHLIIDWDVSSYYPAIIINNGKFPQHLGKEFLAGYKKMFERRLELKPLAKKDSRIRGIVGALKLAVNSVYGKSSDVTSWLYDRQVTMFTTITGELSLMMLIEQYELNGIKVISANTDGVTIMIEKSKLGKMTEINEWWCKITGHELERADYKKIIFSTVNDYIAIKTDGEIKKKGDFLTDFELHKNKSARIVPIALEQYFVHGVPVEHTIRSHNNVFDFAIRQKASKDFHYEGIKYSKSFRKVTDEELKSFIEEGGWTKDKWWDGKEYWTNDEHKPNDHFGGYTDEELRSIVQSKINLKESRTTVYNKLIRYYVSKTGEKLLKVKNADSDSKAPAMAQVEAGEWVCTVCNHLTKDHPMDNINYSYYIQKCERMIRKIETGGKRVDIVINPNQLTLW